MRLIAAFMLLSCLACSALSQEYSVKLSRPSKVGDTSIEITTASSSQQTTVFTGQSVIKSTVTKTEVEFDADNTVLEVDSEGRPTKESLLVHKCLLRTDGKETTPFPEGTLIQASVRNGRTSFEVDGKPVDEKLSQSLILVENLYSGGATDDEIFGTAEKRKVGESWSINADPIPADMARHDVKVEKSGIDGSVRIDKIEKHGDADCMVISAEMTIKDLIPKLPEGLVVESSAMMNSFSGIFPLDPSCHRLGQTTGFKMQMTLKGRSTPDSPEVRIVSTNERSSSQKITSGKRQ